jgi:hypothetical protein
MNLSTPGPKGREPIRGRYGVKSLFLTLACRFGTAFING